MARAPLAERIQRRLTTDGGRITDDEQLIAEANAERDRLSAAAVAASSESVNFALSDDDRDEAAAKAERYKRTATALAGAIAELTARLEAKRNTEARKASEAERAEIIAERDALAERLRTECPVLEAKYVELLDAIVANDARLAAARVGEPSAEAIARGMSLRDLNGHLGAKRLIEMKLPAFGEPHAYAWPKPKPSFDYSESARRAKAKFHKERAAENARWAKYFVTPPSEKRVPVETRRGIAPLFRNSAVLELTAELVEAARKNGCTVEPANGREVGAPAGVGAF